MPKPAVQVFLAKSAPSAAMPSLNGELLIIYPALNRNTSYINSVPSLIIEAAPYLVSIVLFTLDSYDKSPASKVLLKLKDASL